MVVGVEEAAGESPDSGDEIFILFSILVSTATYNLEYNIDAPIHGKYSELMHNTHNPLHENTLEYIGAHTYLELRGIIATMP